MNADPLERFEEEHAEALTVLGHLDTAIEALEAGASSAGRLAEVARALTFIRDAVRRHNENEERALFPLIQDDLPSALFVEEHGELRALERRVDDALHAPEAAHRVCAPARELSRLLRAHIERENQMLFPAARALLGPEGLAAVARRMEAAEV